MTLLECYGCQMALRESSPAGYVLQFVFWHGNPTGSALLCTFARLSDTLFPKGITPTGAKLEELLLDYLSRLEHTLLNPTAPKVKPVNFIIITDGAPTDDPESVIMTAARRLDKNNFPLSQVGIQFVQIGTDPEATEALRQLDDELSAKHDVRVSANCLWSGERDAHTMDRTWSIQHHIRGNSSQPTH